MKLNATFSGPLLLQPPSKPQTSSSPYSRTHSTYIFSLTQQTKFHTHTQEHAMFIRRRQMETDEVLNRFEAGISHIHSVIKFFMSSMLICYVSLRNTWTWQQSEEGISCR